MCFGVAALVSCKGSDDTAVNNNENNNVENNGGEENNSETPKEVTYVLDGENGKSGYEIAKETGFTGSFFEWLDHFTAEEDAEKVAALRELFTLKHELRVDENGDFKVLVLSDVQSCSTKINEETINNIRIVIDREDPDLVIFNGDNSYGMSNARLLKTYITNMAGYCEEKKIPWAHVYGNHDDQIVTSGYSAISKTAQQKVYENFDYCISKSGDPDIFGVGNYVIPVLTHDGSKIAFNIWALDSGGYRADPVPDVVQGGNYFYGIYQHIQQDQIDWYVESSRLLEDYNGGTVPAMMTFHIPLQEAYDAWMNRAESEWTGEKRENISSYAVNCGLFKEIVKRRDVKLIVNSHDHLNDFMAKYNGVKFCYTACIGTEVYHAKDMLGGRVVKYTTSNPKDFETYMSYVQERTPADDNNADANSLLLDMTIKDDNSVTNGATNGALLVSNDKASNPKTVKTDSTLNKKVVSFAGGKDYPSTFNLPGYDLHNDLFNGFSYEIMFKITDNSFTTNYVGILDYEESGGFGLNAYKSSTANSVELRAELASGTSAWNDIRYTAQLDKWYHVVFTYGNNTISLYINGELVGTKTITESMRMPTFANRSGEEYICIGGCAAAWISSNKSTGINGFTGDMAVCRIYSDALADTQIATLYNNVK